MNPVYLIIDESQLSHKEKYAIYENKDTALKIAKSKGISQFMEPDLKPGMLNFIDDGDGMRGIIAVLINTE